MKIHDVIQGTDEWFKVRLGKLTASSAQAISANGKGLETLVFEKVAEVMTGKMKASYTNDDIERGHELEDMARSFYELETGKTVEQVGFVELDGFGCSPDGLVGKDGLVEIKCKNNPNFVRYLCGKKIDTAHEWQMQMQMLVTGRKWCDYVVFNENFECTTVITRVLRDEVKIAKIKAGLAQGKAMVRSILQNLKEAK